MGRRDDAPATVRGQWLVMAPEPEPPDPVTLSVAAYSEQAAEYEATHAAKMLDRVERFAALLDPPSLILDAGCGPGRDLARFVSLGHDPRGVELNPEFAAKAATYAPTWHADLRELTALFPPELFDGIWACASLVHLAKPDAANVLRQFAVLLRDGGRLYACVNTVGETGWLDEPDGRRWYQIWEDGAFAEAVEDAGFRVDQVDRGPFVEVWATRSTGAR